MDDLSLLFISAPQLLRMDEEAAESSIQVKILSMIMNVCYKCDRRYEDMAFPLLLHKHTTTKTFT